MKDLKHISIIIAGQSFVLDIPRDQEAIVKKAERNFNKVWAKWCEDFKSRSPEEVLAMVAFQYARYYYTIAQNVETNEKAIKDFERKLDDILLTVK